MQFTIIVIFICMLLSYQRAHYKAKQKLEMQIIQEESQYSYIDSLLEDGIITECEHMELITRLKENEK